MLESEFKFEKTNLPGTSEGLAKTFKELQEVRKAQEEVRKQEAKDGMRTLTVLGLSCLMGVLIVVAVIGWIVYMCIKAAHS